MENKKNHEAKEFTDYNKAVVSSQEEEQKALEKADQRREDPSNKVFYYPEQHISVVASSQEEADKEMQKLMDKREKELDNNQINKEESSNE